MPYAVHKVFEGGSGTVREGRQDEEPPAGKRKRYQTPSRKQLQRDAEIATDVKNQREEDVAYQERLSRAAEISQREARPLERAMNEVRAAEKQRKDHENAKKSREMRIEDRKKLIQDQRQNIRIKIDNLNKNEERLQQDRKKLEKELTNMQSVAQYLADELGEFDSACKAKERLHKEIRELNVQKIYAEYDAVIEIEQKIKRKNIEIKQNKCDELTAKNETLLLELDKITQLSNDIGKLEQERAEHAQNLPQRIRKLENDAHELKTILDNSDNLHDLGWGTFTSERLQTISEENAQ